MPSSSKTGPTASQFARYGSRRQTNTPYGVGKSAIEGCLRWIKRSRASRKEKRYRQSTMEKLGQERPRETSAWEIHGERPEGGLIRGIAKTNLGKERPLHEEICVQSKQINKTDCDSHVEKQPSSRKRNLFWGCS